MDNDIISDNTDTATIAPRESART